MPIEFNCPSCHKMLRVPDTAAGKKARCPDCGEIAPVPAPASGGAGSPFDAPKPLSSGLPSSSSFSPPLAGQSAGSESPWGSGGGTSGQESSKIPNFDPSSPSSSQADNPFASPTTSLSSEPLAPEAIRSKVSPPAIALMVTGGLGILSGFVSLAMNVLGAALPAQGNGGPDPAAFLVMGAFGVVPAFLMIVRSGFVIYGALQLKQLGSYPLAMTSAILAVIPCFSACCLIDIPFGIWALVVMGDTQVKSAFRRATQ